jgi:hypothetical protein
LGLNFCFVYFIGSMTVWVRLIEKYIIIISY